MKSQGNFQVSVVCRQEDHAWIVQCLEYDIAAQGANIQEAAAMFERTFVGQIAVDLKHGRQPLEDIEPAPAEHKDEREEMKLEWTFDKLHQYMMDTCDDRFECLPNCDSYGHEENCPNVYPVAAFHQMLGEVKKLEGENVRMREALEKYAMHQPQCQFPFHPCNCGFNEVRAALVTIVSKDLET